MAFPLQGLIDTIYLLNTISEAEKAVLFEKIEKANKEWEILDFALKRTQKDKSIAVNILKATIADLETSKSLLEQSNRQLIRQQEELNAQKIIIEEKSAVLNENLRKLELSYKELEQFSYIASHDLKSPLRNIAGFAQLLKKRYGELMDQEAREFIGFIISAVFQMSEVIQALLDYSKVGQESTSLTEVDLNDIIEVVKSNLKNDLENNRACLQYERLPVIKGVRPYFIQLFQNFVGNAIKFRTHRDPVIRITCTEKGSGWSFQVSDNGIGLDEVFQEKVFLPFQRLSGTNIQGTGIGLAICKKIVKMHKGEISYTKNQDGGTTFIFSLYPMGVAPSST